MTISAITAQASEYEQTAKADKRTSATEFEALLIAQMLKSARAESENYTELMRDVAEQQLSAVLAAGGGLGLAKLVMDGLD